MELIGKTILDGIGSIKKRNARIQPEAEPIAKMETGYFNDFKSELKKIKKDPVQVDLYLKTHGLEQVENLRDYILNNNNIRYDSVNELISQQYFKNIANQAHGYSGVKKAIDEYNNSLTELNDGTTQVSNNTNTFLNALSETNPRLAECMQNAEGATISMGQYAASLVATKIKTVLLQAATMAMNMIFSMGVSFLVSNAVSALASWIDKLIVTKEEIKEMAEEAKSAINDIKSNFDNLRSTTDDIKQKFANLAQGVENLGKLNQSRGKLTTDDYKEFLDLSNQLADLFPELTIGFDDNGNAILDLSGNVNTIVGSLNDLVSVQQKLTNQEIMKEMPDVWTGYTADLEEYNETLTNAVDMINEYQYILEKISNNSLTDSSELSGTYLTLVKAFHDIGIDYQSIDGLYKVTRYTTQYGIHVKYGEWDFTKLNDIQFNQLINKIASLGSEYEDKVQLTKNKIASANSEMSNFINTWLSSGSAKWNFSQMNSDMQEVVKDVLLNSDWVSQLPNTINAGNWNEVSNWLEEHFLYAINTINDDKILAALTNVFNGKFTVESLQELIDQIKEIEGFDEKNPLIVWLQAALDDKTEKIHSVKAKLNDELSKDELNEKINTLSDEDLEIASNKIQVDGDTLLSWDELITKIEEYKEVLEKCKPSFIDAFNSSDFAESKEKLLDLAKAGELTPETLSSTEEYNTLLIQTGLLAETAKDKIYNLLSEQEKLAGATTGIDNLKSSYEEFKDLGFVTAQTLEDLPDVFKSLEGYDLFSQIAGDPQSGVDKIQQAFNDIVKEYLIFTQTLNSDSLISDNIEEQEHAKSIYIANLKEMGITNAEEFVEQTVTCMKQHQELIDKAETEYINYLKGEDDITLEYIESISSYNSQLINSLGDGYKTDYDNWISLLQDKEIASSKLIEKLGGNYDENLDVIGNLLANGITPTASNIVAGYEALAELEGILRKYEELRGALSFNPTVFEDSFSSDFYGSFGNSSSSSSNQTFDWIETKITRMDEALDRLDKKTSDAYSSWTDRNKALAQSINKTSEAIKLQEQAYTAYMNEANAVGLPDDYKKLVQNGALYIEDDISNNDLADKINEYKDLYEKAISCLDTANELKQTLNELSISHKWDNIKTELDSVIDSFDSNIDIIQTRLDNLELRGLFANSSYYADMTSLTQKKIGTLTSEANQLQSILNGMSQGTETYNTMFLELMSIRQQIAELENDCIEFNNNIRNLDWEIFEYLEESINRITDETSYLIGLLEREDLFEDNGTMTDYATATLGLHAAAYDTYKKQAQDYYEEVQELQKQLVNGAGQEVLEQYNKMAEAHRDAINAANDEKQSILDLIEDGYNKQLDYINELISKKKEQLNAEKSLYDYQKSITEKANNISSLEKQQLAYQDDTSEEAMSKIQQIKVQLEEAKADLKETEYEKYLSDTESMLDELSDDFESWINARLDNEEALMTEIIGAISAKGSEINNTLNEIADKNNTFISDSINGIFSSNQPFMTAMNGINDAVTGVGTAIIGLLNAITTMTNTNGNISANTASVNSVTSGNTGSTTTVSDNTSGNTKSSVAGSVTSSNTNTSKTNTSLDGILISKKDYYAKDKLNINTSIVDRLKYFDKDSSWSARATYWNKIFGGAYTGSDSQNVQLLNYLKSNGYKSGTSHASSGYHWTQEDEKEEFIIRKSDGAILTPLGDGDMVFNNEASKKLWEFSQNPEAYMQRLGLNPADLNVINPLENFNASFLPTFSDTISHGQNVNMNVDGITISLPNVTNYTDFRNELIKDRNFEKAMFTSINHALTGKGTPFDKLRYSR